MKTNHIIQEDEIDLKEVFSLLWAKKIFIVVITLLFTFGGIAYVSFKKVTPFYVGNVMIEIGEIQSEVFGLEILDHPLNLIPVVQKRGIIASTVGGSSKLVNLSYISKDKKQIEIILQENVKYILNRHKEKSKFYKNVVMSQQVGTIEIIEKPIKEKLIVIIAFLLGGIVSISLVYLEQFIKSLKKEHH